MGDQSDRSDDRARFRVAGVLLADESICVGPAASERRYLNIAMWSARRRSSTPTRSTRLRLSLRNAYLAEVCDEVGIPFVGPRPRSIQACADKVSARNLMKFRRRASPSRVPTKHWSASDAALSAARELGFPLMLKAVAVAAAVNARRARCGTNWHACFRSLNSKPNRTSARPVCTWSD